MSLARYSVKFRRFRDSRLYHVTVTARDPDDARLMAQARDPLYLSSVSVKRRGEVLPPESADPLTASKARADLERGVATFDEPEYATWRGVEVEVTG